MFPISKALGEPKRLEFGRERQLDKTLLAFEVTGVHFNKEPWHINYFSWLINDSTGLKRVSISLEINGDLITS